MKSTALLLIPAAIALALILPPRTGQGCPFCFGAQQATLRERLETPDASLLVEWISGEPGNLETRTPPSTTFRIQRVWRGDLEVGTTLTTDRYYEGRPGEKSLLVGNRLNDVIRWDRAIPLSPEAIEYVSNMPYSSAPVEERMEYALAHLEAPDTVIANDAFDVLAISKYEDIATARGHLDVHRLRQWVHDPQTPVMRLGVYGMLLGLAGNEEDIPQLRRRIFVEDEERPIRLGIDGVMGGYLLLTGADGLDELDAAYLAATEVSPDNLNAVTSAIRFMWEYGEGRIEKERLRQSMRLALEHEETLELAIVDLARWQDWSVIPRLIRLYETRASEPSLHRRIIGFLTVAVQADDEQSSAADHEAIAQAARFLEAVRQQDPVLYRNAQRGLIQR
jgi:hypothetical protein